MLSRRRVVFAALLLSYSLLTLAVVLRWGPLDALDQWVASFHMRRQWPGLQRFVLDYVMLGQRAPSTFAVLPIFLIMARQRRSWQPLLRLGVALLVLNVSVGAVKLSTGRIGPFFTHYASKVFAGGDIFPSGHTANAVMLYGVLATLVAPRWRPLVVAATAWIAVTVGLGTLYLHFHWFSDMVGGWLAGALVIMVLPQCEQLAQRGLTLAATRARQGRVAWSAARSSIHWVSHWASHSASREADAGEFLGPLPESTRDDLVA